jgi:WD40 repeat protein
LAGFVLAGGAVLGYQWSRTAPAPPVHLRSIGIPTPLGADSFLPPAENFSVAWSNDGRYLGLASGAGVLEVKDGTTRATIINDTNATAINDFGWSPKDSRYLACACDDSTVQIYQIPENEIALTYRDHNNPVLALSWTQDGKYIASVDQGSIVNVWEAASLETINSYGSNLFTDQVTSLSWSPAGKLLACGCADSSVLVVDTTKKQIIETYTQQHQAVESVSWSPNGRYIASASDDGSVAVWFPKIGKTKEKYLGHSDKVWCLDWSPDSLFLASGSWDKTVRIWKIGESKPYQIYTRHQDRVVALDWSKQGQISSIDASGNIYIWEINR